MCGIAGIMYKHQAANVGEAMMRMLISLQHRGPDSTGYALYGDRGMGAYVLWLKMPEAESAEEELTEFADVKKEEITDAVSRVGGKVRQSEMYTDYAVRMLVDYGGDIKRLVDTVEQSAEVEVTSFGKSMELIKDVGLADELAKTYKLNSFLGTHAIGHVRMATESTVDVSHAHPFWAYPFSDISVVHNGQITNYWKYRRQLELEGQRFRSRCDSELIAVYLAIKLRDGLSLKQAMSDSITELDGVFTYFVTTQNEIGVAKDFLAAKPLSVMENDSAVALASEEVALRAVFPKEVESWDPYEGEVLVWTKPNA